MSKLNLPSEKEIEVLLILRDRRDLGLVLDRQDPSRRRILTRLIEIRLAEKCGDKKERCKISASGLRVSDFLFAIDDTMNKSREGEVH